MRRPSPIWLVLCALVVGLAAGCAAPARVAIPAPSELSGARWWVGVDFDDAPRYVADGRFRPAGGPVSERVPLPPLFAVPLSPGDCARRPVRAAVAFPRERRLVVGERADFYLTPTDPRDSTASPVAFVCGGQLVEEP